MKTLFLLMAAIGLLWSSERTQVHMGTLVSVDVEETSCSDEVFDEFRMLEALLSSYQSGSEISRLNARQPVELSKPTREILRRSLEMTQISAGAFDVTIGGISHGVYHFGGDERLPKEHELQKGLKGVGSGKLRLIGEQVWLAPGSMIDLGGIGKGYAVDRSIERLKTRGVRKAIVAASGDIGCLGQCSVEIADPFHPEGTIARIDSSLERFAISTSGNYERYIRSKSNNHLLDPKTGKPQQRFASVTLMDIRDNTRIDALATAVAVMKTAEALALLAREGIAYVVIENNGKVYQNGMPEGVRLHWLTSPGVLQAQ